MKPTQAPSKSKKRPNKSPTAIDSSESPSKTKKRQKLVKPENANMEGKLDKLLNALHEKSASTEEKLDNLIRKHEQTDSKIDQLTSDLATIKEKIAKLENAQEQGEVDFGLIKQDVSEISNELRVVQQSALANNFVIHGLPSDLPGVKAFDAMSQLAQGLGVDVQENDLKFISIRKNQARNTSSLTGMFHDGRQRQQLFDRAKEKRPVTVESIFPNIAQNSTLRGKEISFRSQLSASTRALLSKAHELNNNRFKYIWESNGRIMMRRIDGERAIEIRSDDHLMEILDTEQRTHTFTSRQYTTGRFRNGSSHSSSTVNRNTTT